MCDLHVLMGLAFSGAASSQRCRYKLRTRDPMASHLRSNFRRGDPQRQSLNIFVMTGPRRQKRVLPRVSNAEYDLVPLLM